MDMRDNFDELDSMIDRMLSEAFAEVRTDSFIQGVKRGQELERELLQARFPDLGEREDLYDPERASEIDRLIGRLEEYLEDRDY